jgi:hypothetical protein
LFNISVALTALSCGQITQVHLPSGVGQKLSLSGDDQTPAPPAAPAPVAPVPTPTPSTTPPVVNNPPTVTKTTYAALSANILLPKCLGCHNPNRVPLLGNATFTSYAISVKTVIPGKPLESDMYKATKRIVPAAISEAELQYIYDWILEGAQNN